MYKLFDLNSPVMRFMSRMTDLVFLSLLWLVCCLPILTIGPSTAAMYTVALKLARKEDIKVSSTFFKGFKSNFKQGFVLNLIFIVVGVVIGLDYLYFSASGWGESTAITLIRACFLAMGIWWLCIMFYTYPLQAQFFNSIRRTVLNAAILSMRRIGDTVVIFTLNMLPLIVAYASVRLTSSLLLFVRLAPVWVMLAPGAIAFFCAKRFVKIFDPYLNPTGSEEKPEESEEEEE